jgi:transposase-like protein
VAKGKYQEWLTPDGLLLLEGWARDGLTDEQIAANIGINPATLYKWIDRFGEIGKAIKKGKAPVDFQVENAMLKRAMGYDYEEVITEVYDNGKKHIRKVKKHMPGDVTAMIFWLKNRKSAQWRDKPEVNADSNTLKAAKELLEGIPSAID